METIRARGTDLTDLARVIRVIETQSLKGEGTPQNPCRIVKQYWDFDGTLLAEKDYYVEERRMTMKKKFIESWKTKLIISKIGLIISIMALIISIIALLRSLVCI